MLPLDRVTFRMWCIWELLKSLEAYPCSRQQLSFSFYSDLRSEHVSDTCASPLHLQHIALDLNLLSRRPLVMNGDLEVNTESPFCPQFLRAWCFIIAVIILNKMLLWLSLTWLASKTVMLLCPSPPQPVTSWHHPAL